MFEEITKYYFQKYNLTVRLTRVKSSLAMAMMIKGIYGTLCSNIQQDVTNSGYLGVAL